MSSETKNGVCVYIEERERERERERLPYKCNEGYNGETCRSLSVRVKQYKHNILHVYFDR